MIFYRYLVFKPVSANEHFGDFCNKFLLDSVEELIELIYSKKKWLSSVILAIFSDAFLFTQKGRKMN